MGGKASTGSSTTSASAEAVPGTSTTQTTTTTTAKTASGGASDLATLEAQNAIATYFSTAASLAASASTVALDIASQVSAFDSETGQINYSDQLAEGGSEDLARWDEVTALLDFEEAALWQPVVGVLFGMDRPTYQAYIEAGGASSASAPEVGGSIPYRVSDTDTPATIERAFGVTWQRVLSTNRLTPDEALYPGTLLNIPVLRARGEPGIAGLPTFGSHVGRSAWGVDLAAELDGGGQDGDLLLVSEEDALQQGAEFIIDTFGAPLLKAIEQVPSQVKVAFIAQQLQRIFLSDERVESVEEVAVQIEDTKVDVQVRLRAINGTTSITLGGL
jgi:hypothetical protein